MAKKDVFTVGLDKGDRAELCQLANRHGFTLADAIRYAIRKANREEKGNGN